MSAVYTSGLGTYLWDGGVSNSHAGQTSAPAAVNGSASAYSAGESSIDTASISERAQLFSGLETLSRGNPSGFAKVTAGVASNLKAAAANEGDPYQSAALSHIAASFESASKSGTFSDLFNHEAYGVGMGDYEPHAVSQVFAQAIPQLSSELGKIS